MKKVIAIVFLVFGIALVVLGAVGSVTGAIFGEAATSFIIIGFGVIIFAAVACCKYENENEGGGRNKAERLEQICIDIIDNEENKNELSAKPVIMGIISPYLRKADESLIPNALSEMEKKARIMIVNICFDQLSSGRFHIYRGQLNPMSEAPNLLLLYDKSMREAVKGGDIDEATYEDQKSYLNELISSVG